MDVRYTLDATYLAFYDALVPRDLNFAPPNLWMYLYYPQFYCGSHLSMMDLFGDESQSFDSIHLTSSIVIECHLTFQSRSQCRPVAIRRITQPVVDLSSDTPDMNST